MGNSSNGHVMCRPPSFKGANFDDLQGGIWMIDGTSLRNSPGLDTPASFVVLLTDNIRATASF